ncbi:MAG: cupredoxin domain-containing protein [Alphaproteobacteria bacterium]
MQFRIRLFSVALVGGLATFTTLAWAAGTHSGGHGHGGGMSSAIGEPGKASEATRTVEITMRDNHYEPENLTVAKGETVRFVIKNAGELVHEFNIGTAAMHAKHQEEMMMMVEHGALEADKIHHDRMKMDMGGGKTMEHNDPNAVLLEPGKSGEVIWKFTETAELEFACNVPGHYDAGMMGDIHFK